MAATLHEIRELLRAQAPFLAERPGLSTGHEPLDQLLAGGFPLGGLTVLAGSPGSGRMSIAARVLAEESRRGRPVAWIDGRGTLYPPALLGLGLAPERLLVVRAPKEKAVYAAEQVIDSGAFRAVVASGLDGLLTAARARRLQTSAEGARIAVLLLLEPAAAAQLTQVALRLNLTRRKSGILIEVDKDRAGRATGRRVAIPHDARAA